MSCADLTWFDILRGFVGALLSCALLLLRAFVCALLSARFCLARFCYGAVRTLHILKAKLQQIVKLVQVTENRNTSTMRLSVRMRE